MASGPSPPRTALPFEPGSLTPASFLPLFAAFLHAFHAQTHHQTAEGHAIEVKCKVQDHLARLEQPPMFEGRTFSTYEFLSIVRDQGGFGNIRSWTDLCRKLGLNPSKSNISTRIRDWADKHHIIPFFDYILGYPNPYFRELRDDEIVGCIRVEKDDVGLVPETENEMWLRLYGLDGGLRTKKKKPLVVPIQPPPPIAATSSDVSDKRGVADTSEDAHPVKRKRAAADSDRVVMIAGMPFCALSVAEQKVLQEVADALKEHEGIQDDGSISIARGLELSAMSTGGMIQSNGDTLVPSASARLTALSSCLNKLRAITVTAPATSVVSHDPASVDMLAILANVSAGENGDNELKEENARLKVKVAHLMELLKAQNGVLHNVRQRVVTDE